jgi:molybdate transport system regulatory protein
MTNHAKNEHLAALLGWPASNQALELLKKLDETGSINSAAKALGISYKSAWQKLDALNNLLPYPLLHKQTGGTGGGGSALTEEGRALLARLDLLTKESSRFLALFAEHPAEALDILATLRRIEMKLSARNVWLGTVTSIEVGAVNDVVTVQLKGGDIVTSVITDNSVKRLGLEPGKEALAIVKASNVMLGHDIAPEKISARNILTGEVARIIHGAVNDEVIVNLPGGVAVTSIITTNSVKRLELASGKSVSAVIKASDVLLAVP